MLSGCNAIEKPYAVTESNHDAVQILNNGEKRRFLGGRNDEEQKMYYMS